MTPDKIAAVFRAGENEARVQGMTELAEVLGTMGDTAKTIAAETAVQPEAFGPVEAAMLAMPVGEAAAEEVTAHLPGDLALARMEAGRILGGRLPPGGGVVLAKVFERISRPGTPPPQMVSELADDLARVWVAENSLFRQAELLLAAGYRKVIPAKGEQE